VNKALISVLGTDQPGIMAAVATVITEHGGNIENLSQTLLQSVFGALLMVSMPEDSQCEELHQALQQVGQKMRLSIHVDPWDEQLTPWQENTPEVQPYILTVIGPDRRGLVAEVSTQLARHGVNITNIQAIFKGGKNPMDNLMVFEVDVPRSTVMQDLRDALDEVGQRLDIEIDTQHRKIFESVSNISN
jgi:glycine cleavage system transcriptional repressor